MISNHDCQAAIEAIVEATRVSLTSRSSPGYCSIRMPFVYADGDSVEVHVADSRKSSVIIVSDLGIAMARLESESLKPRRSRLERLLSGLGVQIDKSNQLFTKTSLDGLGLACFRMAQAISNLSAVAYLRQATTVDDFLHEFGDYLKSRDASATRNVRRTVSLETKHGPTIQSPRIDFQLSSGLLMMTIPAGPSARVRKVDQCYRTWDVLNRAADTLPRITIVDSESTMSHEDANLLGDFSAVVGFGAIEEKSLTIDDLSAMALERTIAL